jgi:hypothetical protein
MEHNPIVTIGYDGHRVTLKTAIRLACLCTLLCHYANRRKAAS